MTETEWLAGTDPGAMLDFLRARASDRKLRLLSVACWRLLDGEHGRDAVEVAERYAEGLGTRAALKRTRQSVRAVRHGLPTDGGAADGAWGAYWLAEVAASENAFAKLGDEFQRLSALGLRNLKAAEPDPLRTMILEIFGNPFRPVSFDPSRLKAGAVTVARSIYDHRAFDRMSELVESLRHEGEATDEAAHLGEPVPHVRGRWALDLILGRA
ncbi:MAG: hypothetical protein NVSMB9_27420 [Isosphaeraceae bacterium]